MFKEINNKIQLTFPQRHLQLHLQDSRDSYKCFGYTQFKKNVLQKPNSLLITAAYRQLPHKQERKKSSNCNSRPAQSSNRRHILCSHLLFSTTLTLHQHSGSSNLFLEQGINSLILQLYRRISKQMNPGYN